MSEKLKQMTDNTKSMDILLQKQRPNFLTDNAERAEFMIASLLDQAAPLGVTQSTIPMTTDNIIRSVAIENPERLAKVLSKSGEISSLDKDTIVDKLLGLDFILEYGNKTIGLDVTTGEHTVINNKIEKMRALQKTYERLGLDIQVVVYCSNDFCQLPSSQDDVLRFVVGLDEAVKAKNQNGSSVFLCKMLNNNTPTSKRRAKISI